MGKTVKLILAAVLTGATATVTSTAAFAQMQHQHAAALPACAGTELACANVATPAFAPDGSLWLSWAAGGQVMAAHSTDLGHKFSPAIAITQAAVRVDNGPDARPKIAIAGNGNLAVTYAVFQDDHYNGRAYISRSSNAGASFVAPSPLTDDTTSQRFETAAFDPSGDLFVAWLDKRGATAARTAGKKYQGAALAYAWAGTGASGAASTLTRARIAEDQTCECCRLAVGFAGPHQPVVAFRNVFDGTTRDHAVMTFSDATTPGPLYRISKDEWKTNVCPHQGPALAVSGDTYHIAYFTNGQARQGVFYVRSQDGGVHFSEPTALGAGHRAERPTVLAQGKQVWLAWEEFDGETAGVAMIHSGDGGDTWSKPASIATTGGASDHPILVSDGSRVFLSWMTRMEGYRLLPLPGVS